MKTKKPKPQIEIPLDRQWLTPKDAAHHIRIAPGTLRNWTCENKGPKSRKIGRLRRYRIQDIEDWIAKQNPINDAPPRPVGRPPKT